MQANATQRNLQLRNLTDKHLVFSAQRVEAEVVMSDEAGEVLITLHFIDWFIIDRVD